LGVVVLAVGCAVVIVGVVVLGDEIGDGEVVSSFLILGLGS